MADAPNAATGYLGTILYSIGAFIGGIFGYRKFGAARASGQSEEIRLLRQKVAHMEDRLNAAAKKVEELQATVDSADSRQRRIELQIANLQREMRDGMREFGESIERLVQQLRHPGAHPTG